MKWKLGDIAGIGVYIHWSFWILPAWILMSGIAAGGELIPAVVSVGFVFAIFGCVVLHELGHALMARYYRIGTRDITLYPMGGVASLERMPTRPSQELAIALAGPAVNAVIAAALFVGMLLVGVGTQGIVFDIVGGSILVNLIAVNVFLLIFNMLPAFPMDGGRVLRAFLAMKLPYERATEIAARVGQALAIVFGVVGLFSGGLLILVALFVFLAAQAELTMTRARSSFSGPDPFVGSGRPGWSHVPVRAPGYSRGDSGIVWLSDVQTHPDDPQQPRVTRIVVYSD